LSEEKKKMYYYYKDKEKKAGQVRRETGEGMVPYQSDMDMMRERFQHGMDDFWGMPPQWRQWMRQRSGFPMMPFKHMMMLSVDVEDRGKDFRVTVDLPGFSKEDVNIEVGEESLLIHAKKSMAEEEKEKNYVRKERMTQKFYRRLDLPEKVKTDDAKASLTDGILEIVLPKKEPKETKKLAIT
jgi:HSP20 family protein